MIYNTFSSSLTRIGSLFLIALGLTAISCKSTKKATKSAVTSTPTVQKDYSLEDALLWKIEGKGLTAPSYLFGTIHMIEKESFFWPAGTLAAFEDAESVAFEIDMDDMKDPAAIMGIMSKAMMNEGKSLKDLYSAEDYAYVKNHFTEMGIPFMMLERLKPMFLTVFAGGDMEFGQGFGPDSDVKSYEMEFWDLAKESSKDVSGLESIDFQLSVFDSIPYSAQAEMLIETIRSGGEADDTMEQMVEMYKNQEISRMVTFMSEVEEGGIEGYEDVLLYQRNKNWIPIMQEKMSKGQVFFAVGAGHLGGKDGVIDLLKTEGYKMTPLSQVNE